MSTSKSVIVITLMTLNFYKNIRHFDVKVHLFLPSDISEEWAQRWGADFPLHPELHLPAENRFIGMWRMCT